MVLKRFFVLALVAASTAAFAAPLEHAIRACEAGDGRACGEAGLAYERGTGVKRDFGKAEEYFRRAVKLGRVPAHHRLGKLMIVNTQLKAIEIFKKGCAGGDPYACWRLAQTYETLHNFTERRPQPKPYTAKIEQAYRKACDNGLDRVCHLAFHPDDSSDKANKYRAKACKAGIASACLVYTRPRPVKRPLKPSEKPLKRR